MQDDSEKPVALITGGGRGMGRRSHGSCMSGATVWHSCRLREAAKLWPLNSEASRVRGVAEEAADIQAIFDLAMTTYGRIDAVVNHTGHPPKGDLLDITDEQWTLGSDMMILSLVRMARLVTPVMLRQGQGAFVNITTFAAYEPSLVFPVSCTYRAQRAPLPSSIPTVTLPAASG
jgi:NAD(P)-dependent dehydrogenase (short-subunit alcohol dehydrogenase family)